jgi:hypothetical protein
MSAALAATLLLTAAAPAEAQFNPVEFFRGRTHGEGMLKIIFQSPKKMSVDSEGVQEKDGSLVLKQVIHEPGKPPRTRYWRMRQTAPNRFEGTLTDAASPVRVDVTPHGIRIRYTAKDHLNFDQLLTASGPRQVHNKMRVRRFGITVANYDETIRKLD